MQTADWISTASFFVAVLSALYARHAVAEDVELTRFLYIVPERKPRSGTILDFGFKKECNFSAFKIFE